MQHRISTNTVASYVPLLNQFNVIFKIPIHSKVWLNVDTEVDILSEVTDVLG